MASRTRFDFTMNPLTPVVKKCHSSRKNARIASPMWFRCARSERIWHLSTPQSCFSSRW